MSMQYKQTIKYAFQEKRRDTLKRGGANRSCDGPKGWGVRKQREWN